MIQRIFIQRIFMSRSSRHRWLRYLRSALPYSGNYIDRQLLRSGIIEVSGVFFPQRSPVLAPHAERRKGKGQIRTERGRRTRVEICEHRAHGKQAASTGPRAPRARETSCEHRKKSTGQRALSTERPERTQVGGRVRVERAWRCRGPRARPRDGAKRACIGLGLPRLDCLSQDACFSTILCEAD